MNPFDLRGPEFLVFYVALSLAVLLLLACLRGLRRVRESTNDRGKIAALRAQVGQDPYLVACLRDGRDETIRVAIVSLLEQGRLKAENDLLRTVGGQRRVKMTEHPLDKAILGAFVNPAKAEIAFKDNTIDTEVSALSNRLWSLELRPRTGSYSDTFGRGTAALFLLAVALIKIIVALSRGHFNIGFLILFALIAISAVLGIGSYDRTALGDQVLDAIQQQFDSLHRRPITFNDKTGDVAFYAAAFGVSLLPAAIAEILEPLAIRPPPPVVSSSSSGGSSCSSCSSSCGGGGCGGGGCGGCG